MKYFIGIVVAFLLVFTAGCDIKVNEPAAKPAKTVTATATATQTVTVTPQQSDAPPTQDTDSFAAFIKGNTDFLDGDTDNYVVQGGRALCRDFDAGNDVEDEAKVLLGMNASSHDVAIFIGASVSWFCPNYQYKIQDFEDEYNPRT